MVIARMMLVPQLAHAEVAIAPPSNPRWTRRASRATAAKASVRPSLRGRGTVVVGLVGPVGVAVLSLGGLSDGGSGRCQSTVRWSRLPIVASLRVMPSCSRRRPRRRRRPAAATPSAWPARCTCRGRSGFRPSYRTSPRPVPGVGPGRGGRPGSGVASGSSVPGAGRAARGSGWPARSGSAPRRYASTVSFACRDRRLAGQRRVRAVSQASTPAGSVRAWMVAGSIESRRQPSANAALISALNLSRQHVYRQAAVSLS